MTPVRVLIVGGYGVFGARIVTLLENEPRLTLIVAGRSLRQAEALKSARRTQAQLEAVAFDRNGDVRAQIEAIAPAIVVDASGPFQAYGIDRYRVVEACIALRRHYLDLADGSDFVAGIRQFDAEARAAGVFVLSGVSSFPVLTAAVVRHLSRDLERVVTIRAGIAPSPYAGVGRNVIRAIASYAGQRVPLRRNSHAEYAHPFTESARFTIGPPGRVPLRSTLFSLVDVPDLRVLAELWSDVDSVWVGAGPVPEVLHRTLVVFAWLVRLGVVKSLTPLAPLMDLVTNAVRWGEHRGGMIVEITGVDRAARAVRRSWHLLAEGDDGPLIPSMAVAAVIGNVLEERLPALGARPAVGDLELADYERMFATRTIHTGVRDDAARGSLYARLLGSAWDELPPEICAMHEAVARVEAVGKANVVRGRGLLSRLVANAVGFPVAASGTPLKVRFEIEGGVETWVRTFGQRSFVSRQFAGTGRSERLLCERFGPTTFAMALVHAEGRLSLVLRRWAFLGIPLPLWLGPRADAHESVVRGQFHFFVEISHPLTGLIVRYEGELARPTLVPSENSSPVVD